jgi:tetratricopeptide (TPR) repeat protein
MSRPHVSRRRTAPPGGTGRRYTLVAALVVIALGGLVFANSLSGPFIFDDHRTVLDNVSIRALGTALHPPEQTAVTGRPLVNLSFAVNYAVGAYDVEGYHLVNLCIHILAALTLFGVLRRLLGPSASDKNAPPPSRDADHLALACSMLWLVHPLNSEVVDYVTQRTESLAALFYLLTLYAAIRGSRAGSSVSSFSTGRWDVLAISACVCGMLSKESMLTAPLMVIFCDRVFTFPSLRSAFNARYRLYAGLGMSWLIFFALAPATPFFAPQGFHQHVSPWTYLLNQAPIIGRYLRLSLWPRGLVLDYGLVQPLGVMDVWPSALLLVALLASSIVLLVRRPSWGFWAVWFFVTLAPASSLIPIPTEVGAERRMYLPLVAVIVLAASAAWSIGRARKAVLVAAPLLAALFALGTVARNAEYRTGVSIWQTVLDRRPHARARTNLAVELREAGRTEEAVAQLRIAAPEDPEAMHVLGSALLERGQPVEGLQLLQEFVRQYPSDPQIAAAREELAGGLYGAGRLPDAIREFRVLVAAFPDVARGRQNLANALLASRDWSGAALEYREVLRLQPDNVFAQTHLGLALANAGQVDHAIEAFRRALEMHAGDATAERGLVDVLLNAHRFKEAETEIRRLASANPDDAAIHNLLGVSLAGQQRMEEAATEFTTASRLNPQLKEAQDNLARAVNERRGPQPGAPRR